MFKNFVFNYLWYLKGVCAQLDQATAKHEEPGFIEGLKELRQRSTLIETLFSVLKSEYLLDCIGIDSSVL